jgi:DNA-binding beta-propeller fold protein YncE
VLGLVVAFGAAIGADSSPAQPAPTAEVLPAPAWPPPPAPTRIRFLRTLTPAAVQRRPSALSRVFTAIVGGGGDKAAMSQPYGVAVGPDRRVYVADTQGGIVHVYDTERQRYSAIAVRGAESLVGIAFAAGRMFVTDSASGRLLCLDLKGQPIWTLGPKDGFERPTGIAAGPDRVYVVDTLTHRVVIVDVTGRIAGSFGTRGDAPGQFNFPTNITRTADGTLYVTDAMNFRIQAFDRQQRVVGTFGHLGDGSGDFTKPKGLALDSDGHVYVVEGLNDIVQIFDQTGRLLLAFGGSGVSDGQFWLPTGIAIVDDTVYVVDGANRRVQVFEYVKERG